MYDNRPRFAFMEEDLRLKFTNKALLLGTNANMLDIKKHLSNKPVLRTVVDNSLRALGYADDLWQSAENLKQTAPQILAAWNGIQQESSASESQPIDGGANSDSDIDDELDIDTGHKALCPVSSWLRPKTWLGLGQYRILARAEAYIQ